MGILIEKQGSVTTIIINRPEVRNAVDHTTAEKLADAFRAFEADDDARVAVLTGAGDCFCSGADLKQLAEGRGNRLEEDGDGPMGPSRMYLAKPVVAAIAGYAVAGGLELALWCDLRVMESDAVLGVFCRRWGVPLIDGGTVRLTRLIGLSRALDMILTGRPVEAPEAFQMGLANRVVEPGTARTHAETIAAQIACFPQNCLISDRRSTYEQWDLPMDKALKNEFQLGLGTIGSGETAEGSSRFSQGLGRHGAFEEI
ncbi:MAG: crotonase/enoyl-CoA hydratase family protein [Desulfatiglans sp.]|jgi:enoyl-CoA hydratase|nr:crotonase/enoyl-CoA hydratase family protein [Thermodesulfobacteriota bacterium]MEE4353316.1 crotonase/enoyl-CoA hydratase family protein [Desulfatiglans sp.]